MATVTLKRGYSSINAAPPDAAEGDIIYCLKKTKEYCWKKTKEYCEKAPKYLHDYTIGSCTCQSYLCCGFLCYGFLCFNKNRDHYHDPLKSGDDLKEILQFHFMSPFQKWNFNGRRTFPWKLLVQIISIILVTSQLIYFARTKFQVNDFLNENSHTFSKLFVANLQDTSSQIGPIPSPIAHLYTMEEILDQINFTASAYFGLSNRAVGTYGYEWADSDQYLENDTKSMRHLTLAVTKYINGNIDPTHLNVGVKERDIDRYYIYEDDLHNPNRSITDAIMWNKIMEEINTIEIINMELKLSSVSIVDGSIGNPRCFQFTILMAIKRDYDSGSMPLTLKIQETFTRDCRNGSAINVFDTSFDASHRILVLDGLVMLISFIFICLSLRSLGKTFRLACRITRFLIPRVDFHLKILRPLFSSWHVLVIVSNVLALVGSLFKLLLSLNETNDVKFADATSIILGLAVFGQWCGLLRFLSYFDKYNILLRTLKVSAPNVIRFIVCTGVLYFAFLLCGWLVMGPYHPKFRTFYLSSECLFSLINGDDMFNTYILASNSSQSVFIFSKIYLYGFVALFIYVVLSVFISLIEDTYRILHEESIKPRADDLPNLDYKITSKFLHDLANNVLDITIVEGRWQISYKQ